MLHIAVGVIYNKQNQILIARRSKFNKHQAGLWEFPGGKCELGESIEQTLKRELKEEVGIDVQKARPLIRIHHNYPNIKVILDVWQIETWQGSAYGCENQQIRWCTIEQFKNYQFLAANMPIITAIQLPEFYLITPEPLSLNDKSFFYQLEKCVAEGIKLVQLRAKKLPIKKYCYCAEKALKICESYQAKLLINANIEVVLSVGVHGVHLTSQQLLSHSNRPINKNLWLAASCHSSAQIQQANLIEADFIVISPVHITASHPDVTSLGWSKFFQLSEQSTCPAFALGGMQKQDLYAAWSHGGRGIAAIQGLWGN